ncbi:MAG: RES family NAD+ phosphorylase, partial [Chromatocurvus sp.]
MSTLRLVDTLDEQSLLEDILEETKPPVPTECIGLHYLYMTPFRYGSYPDGSRFRRAGKTPGVYYASESPRTAIIETAFHRLLFFA